ncbi:MAG: hypothetical protein QHJ34_11835 [bacterium]|jgi:hypothetical protein|nr:hypothetical protein [candidate division KSB1 bacterium]MDH7560904.1 hypothetical protein [bacterium]
MERRGSQLKGTLVAVVGIVACGVLGYLVVRHVALRRQMGAMEVPYIWDAEELARLARKENPEVKVVLTGEKGLWDREGGPRVELVWDKVLGSCDDTAYAGAGGGVNYMAVAPTGEWYVVFSRYGELKKFDREGRVAWVIGGRGGAPGQLAMPMGVAFDPEGNVCVVEAGNKRVSVFTPSGEFVRSVRLDPLGWPLSFAIDSAGFYYVSWYDEREDKVIHKYDPEGKRVLSFGEPVRFREPLQGAGWSLRRMISCGPILASGKFLYYGQGNPYEVRRYLQDGQLTMLIVRKNSFMEPARLRLSRDGRAIQLGGYSRVSRLGIWGDKVVSVVWLTPGSDQKPRSVLDVFASDGRLLTHAAPPSLFSVAAFDAEGRIWGAIGRESGDCLQSLGRITARERR